MNIIFALNMQDTSARNESYRAFSIRRMYITGPIQLVCVEHSIFFFFDSRQAFILVHP